MHSDPAGPTTLGPGSPSFATTLFLRMSTTSVLGRSRRPLGGGLGQPPSPGGREGTPLGEVSNRNQQTALLLRPGSWEPQAQPQSEGHGELLGGRGVGGNAEGVLGRVPSPLHWVLYAAHWFLEAPKCDRATEYALFSRKGWKGLTLDPAVSLCFPRWVQGAFRRHRLGLRRSSSLLAAPA